MRTFPKSLTKFRELVDERGARLRKLSFNDLRKLEHAPIERINFDNRPATIGIVVQPQPDGGIRVVVQGFMKARWLFGQHVALDGFYKRRDETVTPMPNEEFYEFD